MTSKIPRPPSGLAAHGRRLWRFVVAEYELDVHERVLLEQVARTADLCAELQGIVDAEGVMVTDHLGNRRANPATIELRQQRILFARLLLCLRVPLGEQPEDAGRSQSRPGARGVYSFPGSAA